MRLLAVDVADGRACAAIDTGADDGAVALGDFFTVVDPSTLETVGTMTVGEVESTVATGWSTIPPVRAGMIGKQRDPSWVAVRGDAPVVVSRHDRVGPVRWTCGYAWGREREAIVAPLWVMALATSLPVAFMLVRRGHCGGALAAGLLAGLPAVGAVALLIACVSSFRNPRAVPAYFGGERWEVRLERGRVTFDNAPQVAEESAGLSAFRARSVWWTPQTEEGAAVPSDAWINVVGDGVPLGWRARPTGGGGANGSSPPVAGARRMPFPAEDDAYWRWREITATTTPAYSWSVPAAIPIGALSVISGVYLRRARAGRARRARQRRGLCVACGYDLRATPDRCPECGAAPCATH